MYNRYVPQGDGTFQRNRMPDPPQRQRQPPRQSHPVRESPPPPPEPSPEIRDVPRQEPEKREDRPLHDTCREDHQKNRNASDFFSRFLPKNMDTGDLLMLLILLLLLSDGDEDAPPALLTIALYFLLKSE